MIFGNINFGARKVRKSKREKSKRSKKVSGALLELWRPEIAGLRHQTGESSWSRMDRRRTEFGLEDALPNNPGVVHDTICTWAGFTRELRATTDRSLRP